MLQFNAIYFALFEETGRDPIFLSTAKTGNVSSVIAQHMYHEHNGHDPTDTRNGYCLFICTELILQIEDLFANHM